MHKCFLNYKKLLLIVKCLGIFVRCVISSPTLSIPAPRTNLYIDPLIEVYNCVEMPACIVGCWTFLKSIHVNSYLSKSELEHALVIICLRPEVCGSYPQHKNWACSFTIVMRQVNDAVQKLVLGSYLGYMQRMDVKMNGGDLIPSNYINFKSKRNTLRQVLWWQPLGPNQRKKAACMYCTILNYFTVGSHWIAVLSRFLVFDIIGRARILQTVNPCFEC